jgi:hypothetical protein
MRKGVLDRHMNLVGLSDRRDQVHAEMPGSSQKSYRKLGVSGNKVWKPCGAHERLKSLGKQFLNRIVEWISNEVTRPHSTTRSHLG